MAGIDAPEEKQHAQVDTFTGWLATLETRIGRTLPAEEVGWLQEAWLAALHTTELDIEDAKQTLRDAVYQLVDERIADYKDTR